MNNKKGGFGAKLILVLILMLASAAGGAYGYRIVDGKVAIRDAQKAIADVDVSDYDSPEQVVIQNYIDDAKKDLEKVQTRKEVYEVLGDFISDVGKVQTKNEKALEEALKAAEEAKKESNNSNNNNNYNNSGSYNNDSSQQTENSDDNSNSGTSGSYKSNQLRNNNEENEEGNNSLLDGLFGSMKSN